jgi:cell wall-associated NlpC family hydrolase
VTGAEIVAAARALLGVRYAHQGRSRAGLDCIGLPVLVRAELGLAPLDAAPGYARTSTAFEMLDFCRAQMTEVAPAQIRPGDILVQINGTGRHMAIVCDYPLCPDSLGIIHAWLPNKRVTECRLDDTFMQTVRGCFRFPEVTE